MNQNLIIYSEAMTTNSIAQSIYNANNFQSTEKTTNSTNQQKNYQLQKNGKMGVASERLMRTEAKTQVYIVFYT